jgi:hypothetical protein
VLPAGPTVAMVNQAGTVLLANTPPTGVWADDRPYSTVASPIIGNWCDRQVTLPPISAALTACRRHRRPAVTTLTTAAVQRSRTATVDLDDAWAPG